MNSLFGRILSPFVVFSHLWEKFFVRRRLSDFGIFPVTLLFHRVTLDICLRGHVQMTSVLGGGGGVSQFLTIGGGGCVISILEILTGGGGVENPKN